MKIRKIFDTYKEIFKDFLPPITSIITRKSVNVLKDKNSNIIKRIQKKNIQLLL